MPKKFLLQLFSPKKKLFLEMSWRKRPGNVFNAKHDDNKVGTALLLKVVMKFTARPAQSAISQSASIVHSNLHIFRNV
jgi:hypothetical protein